MTATTPQSGSFAGFAVAFGLFAVAGVGVAIFARSPGLREEEQVVVEGNKARAELSTPPPVEAELVEVDENAPLARVTVSEEPITPADEYVTGAVKVDEMGGVVVRGLDGDLSLRLSPEQVRAARFIPSDPYAPDRSACLDLGDGRRVPVPPELAATLPKQVTYSRADQVKGTPQ